MRLSMCIVWPAACPTCQFGMPYFDRLYRAFQAESVPVFAVAQEETKEAAAFAREYDIQMPQYLDSAPFSVSREYGLMNVPTMIWISADGLIERVTPAFVKSDISETAAWLAEACGVPPPDIFNAGEDVPALKPG